MLPNNPSFLDVHEIHEIAPLVTKSSSDAPSLNSSATSSPPLLTPESSLHSVHVQSSACSTDTPTIRFAPLPQIDPTRKRSPIRLGVSARTRRKKGLPGLPQEGRSLLWAQDDIPDENMEDPIVTLGKFIRRTGKTLWRRVRKKSTVAPEENEISAEPVLEITSSGWASLALGEKLQDASGGKQHRRASWSTTTTEHRMLSRLEEIKRQMRKSTSDLPPLLVVP